MAIIISITSITDGYAIFRNSPYRFGLNEDKDQLPVEATAFLVKNNIKGKILNHLNFGGYLMAKANTKVFIDGRLELIDDDFFSNYYSSVMEENGIKKLLDDFDPDIVMFPYIEEPGWWNYFLSYKAASGYKPVYFDGLSAIYLKVSVFPQVPELTATGVLKGLDENVIKRIDSLVDSPNKPDGITVWLQSGWKKQVMSIADIRKAAFCFANGFDSAALIYSVKGIERSTVHTPDIYRNLSVYYKGKQLLNKAQLCEDKIQNEYFDN
ncbi:hypothetical protein [Ferruginibacter albus]|uniref:hypothetical protein n=1 Tax=Ferruginibacter albus TaxID=2875540 RepID=UPI001CC7268A|nr:hypothetical protein [Ferruginibacter albus]UAY51315.1 hypothetical protein K9M53_12025 [Ferruginibacter albus]